MKKSYNDLDRALTEFHLDLMRYDADVNRRVSRKLREAETIIRGLLLSITDGMGKREANRIIRSAQEIGDKAFESAYNEASKEWGRFARVANNAETKIYNTWLGYKAFSKATKIANVKPEIDGVSFEKWWQRTLENYKWGIEKIARASQAGDLLENEAKQEIRRLYRNTRRNANTIIRTANSYVSNRANSELLQRNRSKFKYKMHFSTLDSKTSAKCKARDGKKWTLDNEPIGHNFPFREPPLHFGCRSIIRFVVNEGSTRASEFGQVDETLDYNEWLKQQSSKYQDKALGKERARLFRTGKVSVQDMVDFNDRPLTLEQLRNKYL